MRLDRSRLLLAGTGSHANRLNLLKVVQAFASQAETIHQLSNSNQNGKTPGSGVMMELLRQGGMASVQALSGDLMQDF